MKHSWLNLVYQSQNKKAFLDSTIDFLYAIWKVF